MARAQSAILGTFFGLLALTAVGSARAADVPAPPAAAQPPEVQKPPGRSETYAPRLLECEPPGDCPIPRSKLADRVMLTGRYARHGLSDNVYPAWAEDGTAYSGFADGEGAHGNAGPLGQGLARWVGDTPFNLKKETLGFMGHPPGFGQRVLSPRLDNGYYPCFSLIHKGIYYYGVYGAHGSDSPKTRPFMGFFTTKVPIASTRRIGNGVIDANLWTLPKNNNYFGEQAPFRFRVPHAVDMGLNLEYSPDGMAYMVSHGATRLSEGKMKAVNDLGNGDAVFLARFTPDPKLVHAEPPQGFVFWAGKTPEGKDRWSEKVTEAEPMVRWDEQLGALSMSYLPATKRWWLIVGRLGTGIKDSSLLLLEAPQVTGPWSLCAYVRAPKAMPWCNPTIPVKYQSSDPSRMWIIITGSGDEKKDPDPLGVQKAHDAWPGIAYGACFIEFALLKPGETPPTAEQLTAADAAAAKERKP